MPEKKPPKKVPSAGQRRCRIEENHTTATSRQTPTTSTQVRRPPGAASSTHCGCEALALPRLPQPAPGQAINLGPIAGTESPTGALGAGAVDLCEISPGGQVALGGDTFSGNVARSGAWSPSMALHVRPGTLNSNPIQFDSSFGQNGALYAEPPPPVVGGSQLPAGTVQVFGIDYALVTRTVEPSTHRYATGTSQPQRAGMADRSGVLEGRSQLAGRQRNTNQRLPGARRLGVYRRRRVRPRSHRTALSLPRGDLHGPKHMVGLGNQQRRPRLGLECGPDTS